MILGVDIGGTSAKIALVDENGCLHGQTEVATNADGYVTPVIDSVMAGVEAFLEKTGVTPEGIGVSATGQIDDQNGVVIGTNGKIPNYEGTEIKRVLEERFHVPVWALNDANAAALGECFAGRGKGKKNVIMVTLGTGVGGGIVLNGQVYGGTRGIAGEIGHFTLYQDGVPCPCGKKGCYESYASTSALVAQGRKILARNDLDGRRIFAMAENGDTEALRLLAGWIDDIAAGIGGLVHIFNPEMILIGGGVSRQEKLLMEPLRKKVSEQIMPRFREGLTVEAAALGNDAGVIGAAAYWMDREKRKVSG